ncbi:dpnD protein [Streptococcus pneumoniae]|nr:dpnD protein [Streptococcus pneumoniae]
MKTKQLVASEEVYDFLKVIWPDYETESRYDNLSLTPIIHPKSKNHPESLP